MSSIDYNVSVSRHDKDYWECVWCPCSVTLVVALQYIQVRFRSGSVNFMTEIDVQSLSVGQHNLTSSARSFSIVSRVSKWKTGFTHRPRY